MPPASDTNPLFDRISQPIVTAHRSEALKGQTTQQIAADEQKAADHPHVRESTDRQASNVTYFVLLLWVAIAVILGFPRFGANSGSLIVSTVAFGTGWLALRRSRKLWLFACGFGIAGIAITFGFAYFDARLLGAQSSHAGAALQTAATKGATYLWDIVVRKLRFNIGMLSAPWTWVTVSACAGALLLAPMLAEHEIEETKQRRKWLARSLPVIVSTSVAALLFKDTGVVTVCYLMSAVIIVGFYYMLVPNSKVRHAIRSSGGEVGSRSATANS